MKAERERKPLLWVGPSREVLRRFPLEVRKSIGFALAQAQEGGKHKSAKPLKGFGGGGILEIVSEFDGNAFRAVYTVKFAWAVYTLHVFQKKSKQGIKTPKQVVELIRQRLQMAEAHYRREFE